ALLDLDVLRNAAGLRVADQLRLQRIRDVHDLQAGLAVGHVDEVADHAHVDRNTVRVEAGDDRRMLAIRDVHDLQPRGAGRDIGVVAGHVDVVGIAGDVDGGKGDRLERLDRDGDDELLAAVGYGDARSPGATAEDLAVGRAEAHDAEVARRVIRAAAARGEVEHTAVDEDAGYVQRRAHLGLDA